MSRTFIKNDKKQIVDGNSLTTAPIEWEGQDIRDEANVSLVRQETLEDGEVYIQLLLDNGYTEIV